VERLNSGSSVRLLRSVFVGLTAGGSACDSTRAMWRRLLPAAPARARTHTTRYVREIFVSVSPTHRPATSGHKILLFEKKKNHRLDIRPIYIYIYILCVCVFWHPVPSRYDGNWSIEVVMMMMMVMVMSGVFRLFFLL